MREQLIHYLDLLFAGAEDAEDIKQEILQNTLDRYDDLIDQGKTPEAAYRLAISGIGDINELLSPKEPQPEVRTQEPVNEEARQKKRLLHTIATACWILTPIPLFLIDDEVGLCLTLVAVSLATALNIYAGKLGADEPKKRRSQERPQQEYSPRKQLRSSISMIVSIISLIAYVGISMVLDMWILTLLIFPLFAAIKGVIFACIDLKEAEHDEN